MTSPKEPREWVIQAPSHFEARFPGELEVMSGPILERFNPVVVIEKSHHDAVVEELKESVKIYRETAKRYHDQMGPILVENMNLKTVISNAKKHAVLEICERLKEEIKQLHDKLNRSDNASR